MPEAKEANFVYNGTSYSGADIKLLVHTRSKEMQDVQMNKWQETDYDIQREQKGYEDQINQIDLYLLNNPHLEPGAYERVRADIRRQRATESLEISYNLQKEWDDRKLDLTKSITGTIVLASIQTLSLQVFREKTQVRALGSTYCRGVTRGSRTIAGSMIFTVFDRHPLYDLIYNPPTGFADETSTTSRLIDQLPPMEVTVLFANEYGNISEMKIYGVEFVNDGQTMSIENILLEGTTTFIARDYDIMASRGNILHGKGADSFYAVNNLKGSDLLTKHRAQLTEYENRLGVRRNPYR